MKLPRRIKHLIQRLRYGFDDSDTWSLDMTMAKWLVPRLKRFQKLSIGVPEFEMTQVEWSTILYKMIVAFELIANQYEADEPLWHNDPRVEEGLNLFRKYYLSLWW